MKAKKTAGPKPPAKIKQVLLPQGAAQVKLLVFDMGHVFVDFEWEQVLAGFCRLSSRSTDELRQVLRHVAKLGYESGKCDTKAFVDAMNEGMGTSMSIAEFTAIWNHSFRENQEMARLLATLKSQRPIYLLSNTNEVHYNFLQGSFNVARHFEELILSYEVGCAKPEPAIYQEVLRRSGLAAADCLFVDDLEVNILAAHNLGMQAIQFKGHDHLAEKLESLGFRTR